MKQRKVSVSEKCPYICELEHFPGRWCSRSSVWVSTLYSPFLTLFWYSPVFCILHSLAQTLFWYCVVFWTLYSLVLALFWYSTLFFHCFGTVQLLALVLFSSGIGLVLCSVWLLLLFSSGIVLVYWSVLHFGFFISIIFLVQYIFWHIVLWFSAIFVHVLWSSSGIILIQYLQCLTLCIFKFWNCSGTEECLALFILPL